MDVERIRVDFPMFKSDIHYLDNAATSLKPYDVLEKVLEYYKEYSANVHRSPHRWGEKATEELEKAREKVARFIGAKAEEIVFTKNATEALNLCAYALKKKVRKVATSIAEHHSNFIPWQQLYDIDVMGVDREGFIVSTKSEFDLLAFHHISNVTGAIQDVGAMKDLAEERGAITLLDASQSAPHTKLDVKELGIDLMAFTGHKMLGPTGIGVLYVREGMEKEMEPFQYGGEMINSVSIKESTFAEMPHRYEAGTPPIAQAIGLGEAISYLERLGMEEIRAHEASITAYALKRFEDENIPYIGPKTLKRRTGIISFYIEGIHPHDIASLLSTEKGVAIRAGHHCTQPLHKALGLPATARASFYLYNSKEDVDAFFEGLESIRRRFYG